MTLQHEKTPVISRSFNHQSKNEQLIRLLSRLYQKSDNRKLWTCKIQLNLKNPNVKCPAIVAIIPGRSSGFC
ncbi:MAG TPA: hypothetical protein VK183_01580, partial [Flavobacterium sp.]|nr:hypothetical protein [Flavobacterium sp.]